MGLTRADAAGAVGNGGKCSCRPGYRAAAACRNGDADFSAVGVNDANEPEKSRLLRVIKKF